MYVYMYVCCMCVYVRIYARIVFMFPSQAHGGGNKTLGLKKAQEKTGIVISHINPLLMKPNKVWISLQHAYAYAHVLCGSRKDTTPALANCFAATESELELAYGLGLGFRVLAFSRV